MTLTPATCAMARDRTTHHARLKAVRLMTVRYWVARPALVLAAVCLTVLTTACSATGAPDPTPGVITPTGAANSSAVYYLSLGDSLSQGVQPVGTNGGQLATDQGYVDNVYAHYHAESKFKSSLTLVKLGCSG